MRQHKKGSDKSRSCRHWTENLERRTLLSTIYVDASAPGVTKNGAAWDTAFVDLQSALGAAVSGDEIRVADGTYKPTTTTSRTTPFTLKSKVAIYGGYAGYGADNPNLRDVAAYPTVLSGEIGTASLTDNSYAVLSATSCTNVILDGLAISDAYCTSSSNPRGGLYASASTVNVNNCLFTNNNVQADGAGICALSSSTLTVTNSTFLRNSAGNGGGISASYSTLNVYTSKFLGNIATGGGISLLNPVSANVVNSIFVLNRGGNGGGVYGPANIANCTFVSNSANTGGAVYGGGAITNSILWNNTATTSPQVHNPGTISYSLVQGGAAGTGIIDADPHFRRNPSTGLDGSPQTFDDDYGYLAIATDSPCIDAGKNAASGLAGITADIFGNSRFYDAAWVADTGAGTAPIIDIGACESVTPVDISLADFIVCYSSESPVLSATAFSTAGASIVSYAWDFDNDGQYDNATGANPDFPVASFPTRTFLPIAVKVIDSEGNFGIGKSTVMIIQDVYVDENAVGANNGTSWQNAYPTLSAAFANLKSYQTLHVADGTYKTTPTTDRTISFNLKSNVSVLGGYAGNGAANPNLRDPAIYPTILSGDIGVAESISDNTYTLLKASSVSNVVLDGLTITQGASSSTPGGLGISNSDIQINNCQFLNNYGANGGGGAVVVYTSTATFTNCVFTRNSGGTPSYGGGAVYVNSCSPNFYNCQFNGNTAYNSGGAIYFDVALTTSKIVNCTFVGNSTTFSGTGGSAIQIKCSVGNPTYKALISNCVFVRNYGKYTNPVINSNTNSAILTNSILWANVNPSSYPFSVSYCDISPSTSGTGKINADPCFLRDASQGADAKWGTADDDYGDLRISPYSPCIDAGSNATSDSSQTTDQFGNPRYFDASWKADTGAGTAPIIDIGAYEVNSTVYASLPTQFFGVSGATIPLSIYPYDLNIPGVVYQWDFDNDGLFDDATGPTADFPTDLFPTMTSLPIAVKATDPEGFSIVAASTVYIYNPVVYVDQNASGANDGTSWTNAYASLTTALTDAVAGQMIRIADGTYKPTDNLDRTISFTLSSGIALYGGYAGSGAANPDARDTSLYPTVLSGNIGDTAASSDNTYHVLFANSALNVVLDGLTVSDGQTISYDHGGGLYAIGSFLSINNCRFVANNAYYGGAIALSYSGIDLFPYTSSITQCQFIRNTSISSGAGISLGSVNASISHCGFYGNYCNSPGVDVYSSTINTQNMFTTPITNCVFSSNLSNPSNSGVFTQTLFFQINNCTFAYNKSSGYSVYNAFVTNSLFYGSASKPIYPENAANSLNCLASSNPSFYRNPSAGPDNVWRTLDDDFGDLRLRMTSPAIDAGQNLPAPALDFDGNPRINNGVVDIGAYEMIDPVSTTGTSADDVWTAKLSADGLNLELYNNTDPSTPIYSYPLASTSGVKLDLGAGNDTLILDSSNGDNLILSLSNIENIRFITKSSTGLKITPSQISIQGRNIPYTGAPSFTLDNPTVYSLFLEGAVTLKLASPYLVIRSNSYLSNTRTWLMNASTGAQPAIVCDGNPTLAIIDNSKLHKTSFAGQTLSSPFSQLLIQPATPGDANLNGVVDQEDLMVVYANLNKTNATWLNGDVNSDGKVDLADLAAVQSSITKSAKIVLKTASKSVVKSPAPKKVVHKIKPHRH